MKSVRIDLTGERFGRLVVAGYFKTNGKVAQWRCLCDCGRTHVANSGNLSKGHTRSCGCLKKDISTKHGDARDGKWSGTYTSWVGMIDRCESVNNASYDYYGGRGITVCEGWLSYEQFKLDMGERPDGTSIDRINTNKGYCKDNCRWTDRTTQSFNTRIRVDNKSGVPGVWWSEARKKWHVKISKGNKKIHVGSFASIEDAIEARINAEIELYGECKI